MLSPRWKKMIRDLWTGRGRITLMIAALAIGLFALGTTLGAFGILSRELSKAYLATRPASATLETAAVTPALVEQVRHLPGVMAAEARATVRARVKIGEDWRTLLLFVIPDFTRMELSTFDRLEGQWPPPTGSLLVEHMALPILPGGKTQPILVKSPNGTPRELSITGVVWDSALAPAGMEQTVWGYITPETLSYLGETGGLDEVKLLVDGPRERIESTARNVAAWLQGQGHPVREIQVPPPGEHPHQGQMRAVMLMFIVFATLALSLSGVLLASTLNALMARQVREIGIMKTLGADRLQIAHIYLVMLLALGLLSWILAVVPSYLGAQAQAGFAASNLNLRIASTAIPSWVFLIQAAAALGVPVLAGLVPVLRASRVSVQRALNDTGITPETFGKKWFEAFLGRWRNVNPLALLGMRNTFRKRGRLAFTLGLLAAGGAMFMTGLNFAKAWNLRLSEIQLVRKYDATLRLQKPEPIQSLLSRMGSVSGVEKVEAWGTAAVAWGGDSGIPIVRTYPDKGHGSFQMLGIPPESTLVDLPLTAGRWLRPQDTDAVVLNHVAAANAPGVHVGSTITLSLDGKPHKWRVVGVVRELGSPATAFVSFSDFSRIQGVGDKAQVLGIRTSAHTAEKRAEVLRRMDKELQKAGFGIDLAMPVSVVRTAMSEHMSVLLGLIMGLAGLMTGVGVLGLSATMSIAMLERTRELGVMRAVGASPLRLMALVLGEGLFTGLLSTLPAILFAVPLTLVVNRVVGSLAFRMPLPLAFSFPAFGLWIGIAAACSILATLLPALRASRMTVREALAYV